MSTTTPQIPSMPSHTSPTKSTPRRVLGDISPRTVNTPPKQTTNKHEPAIFDDLRARSPLKQVQTHSHFPTDDKENASIFALNAGRKRSIDEMHGAGHKSVARMGSLFATRDVNMPAPKVRVLSETPQERSINRDDHDRGSSTEPDTPIASPEPERINDVSVNMGEPSQESNASFSAFVDWAECATLTTQASEAAAPVSSQADPAPPTTQSSTPKQPSRADLLRLRLGFAGYKVRTSQIARPVSEILTSWEETETESTSNAATPRPFPHQKHQPNTTGTTTGIPSIIVSSASSPHAHSPAQLHIKARLDPGVPIPKLSSASAPILLPTSYSSRTVHYAASDNVPSSPPQSQSRSQLPDCVSPEEMISPRKRVHGPSSRREDYRTPAARRVREADYEDEDENVDEDLQREVGTMDVDGDAEEVANSTDSDDMTITERLARQRERGFSVGELSSSVVKGRAALGLLELGGGRGREWRGRGSI